MTRKKLGRKEAAEYLGITPGTLNKWASVGRPWVPYYRIGRKAVYDVADLDAFMKKHLVKGGEHG